MTDNIVDTKWPSSHQDQLLQLHLDQMTWARHYIEETSKVQTVIITLAGVLFLLRGGTENWVIGVVIVFLGIASISTSWASVRMPPPKNQCRNPQFSQT